MTEKLHNYHKTRINLIQSANQPTSRIPIFGNAPHIKLGILIKAWPPFNVSPTFTSILGAARHRRRTSPAPQFTGNSSFHALPTHDQISLYANCDLSRRSHDPTSSAPLPLPPVTSTNTVCFCTAYCDESASPKTHFFGRTVQL